MGMAAILFNCAEPFEQFRNTFWQKAACEIRWNLLTQFQRRRHLKITHNFMHIYSPVARTDNPQGTNFWLLLKYFTTLITHCKFQLLVFNSFWENDFSTVTICTNFQPPLTQGSTWSLKKTGPGVTEEKSFKGVNGRTMDGRTDDDGRQVITTGHPKLCSDEIKRQRWSKCCTWKTIH